MSSLVTFDLSITSIEPPRGGFGGVIINITGVGFDPAGQRTTVTVCNASCSITRSSYNSLTCQVPPTDPGTLKSKDCDITVTNENGPLETSKNGFTYNASLTPSILDVTPRRGGTAGGTRIKINGTGFSYV
ncbi:fibrocystin-L-like [Macrobrachium nipponense]|uniref:fibrocystin-L-like n=1 Tax=Macrobrachium nipponense TaxID=159736 RepID=UPI0030C80F31